jgi:hypothetical protein
VFSSECNTAVLVDGEMCPLPRFWKEAIRVIDTSSW